MLARAGTEQQDVQVGRFSVSDKRWPSRRFCSISQGRALSRTTASRAILRRESGPHIARQMHNTRIERERAYLVAVQARRSRARGGSWNVESSLEELGRLVNTAGGRVVGKTIQKLDSPHPAQYVGAGRLDDIVAQRETIGYNLVVFDDELTPRQQRKLEAALDVKVLDRTALILDIFAMRAKTREGRLQVELAQSEYLLPRLAGQWNPSLISRRENGLMGL